MALMRRRDFCDVRTVKGDAARVWRVNARDHPRDGGFTAAGMPHQRENLATVDVGIQILNRINVAADVLADIAQG